MTNKTKTQKCSCCEVEIDNDKTFGNDDGEGGAVCDSCYSEAEPIATITYSDNRGELEFETTGVSEDYITPYKNDTDFVIEWVSTDAWRGYYDVKKHDGWTKIHSDNILAMSKDEKDLKEFDEIITKFLNENNIVWAKVFCRSSNVFSCGYDLFINTTDKDILKKFKIRERVLELVNKLRDEGQFIRTAITGSDEKTRESDILIKAVKKMEKGEKIEDVRSFIIEEITK